MTTRRIRIKGAVQGVGFRPFVYRLAHDLDVVGWVLNDADGVLLEATADPDTLDVFVARLREDAPSHARIDAVATSDVGDAGYDRFEIRPSPEGASGVAGILPDLATCSDCLAEVFDPSNRRLRYPFTNCTNCGPRFSIVVRLPYDRANTTMAKFPMCPACRREYDDPLDRRFHAQPNACPDCGPTLRLGALRGEQALDDAIRRLSGGEVVAVKGLGGFHLMVDATNEDAVMRLRARKRRARKPFAVMFADRGQLTDFCAPDDVEMTAVTSPPRPIVLMRSRGLLPNAVAPGNPDVGALLPYTPLHHLILRDLDTPVVATSGNVSGEPICIDGDVARDVLKDIADAFLDHDRPIRRPVEDSVVRRYEDTAVVLRRGRGLAPAPVGQCPRPGVVGRGAQLKTSLAVSRAGAVIAGPHIGDLTSDLRVLETYEAAVRDFDTLFEPDVIAVDLHPDMLSRRGVTEVIEVQHHHAHAAACLAEHDLESALAVVWDGTGYGPDGTIWGGEFLRVSRGAFERVAHLRPFRLPGGEAAIRRPSRQAAGLLWELEISPEGDDVAAMLDARINCPVTNSAGRLFDAVSAILDLAPELVEFDGEAAIALEHAAGDEQGVELQQPDLRDGVLDWEPLVRAVIQSDAPVSSVAAGFHDALARGIADVARRFDGEHVLLVGGCFQNRRLLESAAAELRLVGKTPRWCQQIPPNDGGIAVGQVIVAASRGDK